MNESLLFKYPAKAKVDRVIAKERIYQAGYVSVALERNFIEEVGQIRWSYKLSEATLNLPSTENFKEFQVILIVLKGDKLNPDILAAIDKTIPFPLIFEIEKTQTRNGEERKERRLMAAYKTHNWEEKKSIRCSDYYYSDWFSFDSERVALPPAINLEKLYQQILMKLLPAAPIDDVTFEENLQRQEKLGALEREIKTLTQKMNREKQFNRRVKWHQQLQKVKQEKEELLHG